MASDASVRLMPMELNYSPDDVRHWKREGQAQGVNTGGTTDTSRLSLALPTIGCYLTPKYSRMLRLSRRGDRFPGRYEGSVGSHYGEYFSATDLDNLWVRGFISKDLPAEPSPNESAGQA